MIMEDLTSNIILPPNKEMDVTFEFSETPKLYDYFLFLDFNSDGSCLLGSSDLPGTFWEGTVMYFRDVRCLENFAHSKYYIHMTATDGKFVSEDAIAVAEDTGVLNILSIDDSSTLKPMNYFRHARRISEIAVFPNSSKVLCCSGVCIMAWDVNSNEKRPFYMTESIHSNTINSIDILKPNPNLFLSASSDRRACLWDIRTDESPTVLYNNEFSSLTKVTSNPQDSNYAAIGTQSGDVYLIDRREPGEFLATTHCFNNSINDLAFNESHQLGVAGDTRTVFVFNVKNNNLKEVYRDSRHENQVKDLKWYDSCLYSCGFGVKQVIKHSVASQNEN